MTSREKVLEAERQVQQVVLGHSGEIQCPFCGLMSIAENEILCCELMAEVTHAVLDHVEHLGRSEGVKRILDRFMDMRDKAALN